jgi:hypothetical protein
MGRVVFRVVGRLMGIVIGHFYGHRSIEFDRQGKWAGERRNRTVCPTKIEQKCEESWARAMARR